MTEVLNFIILGLGVGAIYALLAQGVLVIYRGSGVVNFGQGALALLGAIAFVEARGTLGTVGAVICAVVVGAVAAILVQNFVIWPLRTAAPIARIIATLGLLITVESGAYLKYGNTPVPVSSYLPHVAWHFGGVIVPSERIELLGIAVVLAIVLWQAESRTLIGLATRASAENDTAAASLGWSPNRLATVSWGVGGALAGLAGALVVPITGLLPATISLLIVPALAAALVGRFDSFLLTTAGAVLLGVGQSLLQRYWTQTGVADAVPFVLIITILVLTGRSLPIRGHLTDRLPKLGNGVVRVVPALFWSVAGILLIGFVFPANWIDAFTVSLSVAIVVLSVVVLTGYAGQISLAQYAMAGLGAFVAGRLVSAQGWPFELALPAGVVAAIPLGLFFAVPAMRTRGVNLAVVSLGLGVAVQAVVFNNVDFTGGFEGTSTGITSIFGININPITHANRYGVFTLVAFIVSALIVANLRRSAGGRRLIAIRENERAAASLGISVIGSKLYAFSVASALAGLGGIIIAFRSTSIEYSAFDPFHSINATAFAVIGGIGYVLGPLAGATLTDAGVGSLFQNLIPDLSQWLPLIGGVVVVTTLLLNRDGMIPGLKDNVRQIEALMPARIRALGRPRKPVSYAVPEQSSEVRARVTPQTLSVSGLTVRYGGVTAVDSLTLEIAPGQIVGLIGPNGAGKTSAIDAISGYTPSAEGTVALGRNLRGRSASQRVKAGLARSWQSLELFEDVSVFENLQIASESSTWHWSRGILGLFHPGRRSLSEAGWAAVSEFDLADSLALMPDALSYSERRLVGIARAVALNPSTLLLDEPAAGLSTVESRELGALMRRLADQWGMGILLVEHDVDLVMTVCDTVHVLEFGKHLAQGNPEEIRRNPDVVRAYLGSDEPPSDRDSKAAPDVPAKTVLALGGHS